MKPAHIIAALCLFPLGSFAQKKVTVAGKIQDENDGSFLAHVAIRNLRNPDITATSDSAGCYSITVFKNDSVRFTLPGYEPRILIFTGENEAWFETVLFSPPHTVLDTVMVAEEMTEFEKSSLRHRQFYSKVLDYKPPKARLPGKKDLRAGQPLRIFGPLSGLLGKASGDYRRSKSFRQMYAATESGNFLSQKYDTALVTELTGLTADSLYRFMQAYPMSFDFANNATEMEIRMWIRYNYREWMEKKP